jgi:hypothetical protein
MAVSLDDLPASLRPFVRRADPDRVDQAPLGRMRAVLDIAPAAANDGRERANAAIDCRRSLAAVLAGFSSFSKVGVDEGTTDDNVIPPLIPVAHIASATRQPDADGASAVQEALLRHPYLVRAMSVQRTMQPDELQRARDKGARPAYLGDDTVLVLGHALVVTINTPTGTAYVDEELNLIHAVASAHAGTKETVRRASAYLYFEGMGEYIRSYVHACVPCQYAKAVREAPSGHGNRRLTAISRPFQVVEMDHMLMPTSSAVPGNEAAICTIYDRYTRAILMQLVPNLKAAPAIEMLHRRVTLVHGAPAVLHVDGAQAFTGTEATEYCDKYGIALRARAPHNARETGGVERSHQTIGAKLRALAEGQFSAPVTPNLVDVVENAMLQSVNATTGISPYECRAFPAHPCTS